MDSYETIRIIDHTTTKNIHGVEMSALTSFAIDDALTESVGEQLSPPTLRLWKHPKTVVLGIPDSRLPYIERGIQFLSDAGYNVIVRNSGGLAVALDQGVLNLSFILPNSKQLTIDASFENMLTFIRKVFVQVTDQIEAYEIIGSYCPGDYDLSIDGIKFAGISQRRIRKGVATQIYIDINGNDYERAKLIQKFYEKSLQGEQTKFTYPTINPHVLGSLKNILNKNLTVEFVKNKIYETVGTMAHTIDEQPLMKQERETFQKRYKQMIKRNELISNILS